MAEEFEIKALMPSPQITQSLLDGFSDMGETAQCDIYLDTPARSLFRDGIFLRVRNERMLQIKYTPDKSNLAHIECEEEELSLPLSAGEIARLRKLLTDVIEDLHGQPATVPELCREWGLEEFVRIEKHRKRYVREGAVISIDTVAGLGQFIEIEVNEPTLRAEYVSRATEYGLKHIPVGYVELLLRATDPQTYRLGRFVLQEDANTEAAGTARTELGSWSISAELCKLAKTDSLADALASLNMIPSREDTFVITGGTEWRRGGNETYICDFLVLRSDGSQLHLLLKACVAFGLGSSVESILTSWIKRRALLSAHGVVTPHLYFAGQGVVLEAYVPFEFWTVLREAGPNQRSSLIMHLAHYIATLAEFRFRPIDAFSDLRSNGADVVVIDFGEDIGPPDSGDPQSAEQCVRDAIKAAAERGVTLTSDEKTILFQQYPQSGH